MDKVHRFRVFVSYSHEDRQLARKVVDALREKNVLPIWDDDIRPGAPFSDAIKGLISHAHLFMPIITPNAQQRPWVHQETGYAMAINIPVLPVAVNSLPSEMTAQLQAITVKDDFSDVAERLAEVDIERVVFPPPSRPTSIVEVADWPETRTELIAQYANQVMELGDHGYVRQRGALSSFCIPDKGVDDPVWALREGKYARSHYYHTLQREERRTLELHARERGCSLIINPEAIYYGRNKVGSEALRVRLATLLEFRRKVASRHLTQRIRGKYANSRRLVRSRVHGAAPRRRLSADAVYLARADCIAPSAQVRSGIRRTVQGGRPWSE